MRLPFVHKPVGFGILFQIVNRTNRFDDIKENTEANDENVQTDKPMVTQIRAIKKWWEAGQCEVRFSAITVECKKENQSNTLRGMFV